MTRIFFNYRVGVTNNPSIRVPMSAEFHQDSAEAKISDIAVMGEGGDDKSTMFGYNFQTLHTGKFLSR